jgi:hypothetical protein
VRAPISLFADINHSTLEALPLASPIAHALGDRTGRLRKNGQGFQTVE